MKKKILKLLLLSFIVSQMFCLNIFAKEKKGVLYVDNAEELSELGCGHVAINYTLGMGSNTSKSDVERIKSEGVKVTFIITNKINSNTTNTTGNPAGYTNPVFYMIDMNQSRIKSAFEKLVREYGDVIDNYVIGNEISDQSYNYYKPAPVEEYTKKYCDSFKTIYHIIKNKNSNANVFIPFDQSWDMPALNKNSQNYNSVLGNFKYNTKEMLTIINNELGKDINWGVAAHPYPDPLSSPVFWDDTYAGHSEEGKEPNKAYVVTINNIEIMCNFLQRSEFLNSMNEPRKILISEIGFSSSEGEEKQAAAFAYAFQKIRDNDQIIGLLYNAQVDTGDGYHFGLRSDSFNKREIWDVFRTIDTDDNADALSLMVNVIPESANYATGTSVQTSGGSYDQIKNQSTDELINNPNNQQATQETTAQITTNNNYNNAKDITTNDTMATITIASTNNYSYNYEVDDETKVKFSFKLPVFTGGNQSEVDTLNNMMQNEGKEHVDQYMVDFADEQSEYPSSINLNECRIKSLNANNVVIRFEGKASNNANISFDLYYDRQNTTMWTD